MSTTTEGLGSRTSSNQTPKENKEGKDQKDNKDLKEVKEKKQDEALQKALKLPSKLNGSLLFACFMIQGMGDLGHFIDIASPKELSDIPACKNQKVIRILAGPKTQETRILQQLKQHQMQDTLLVLYSQTEGRSIIKEVVDFIKANKKLLQAFQSASAIVNISTFYMDFVFREIGINTEQKPVMILGIGEHGANSYTMGEGIDPYILRRSNEGFYRHMGFGFGHHGGMLRSSSQRRSHAESLANIQDLDLLTKVSGKPCTQVLDVNTAEGILQQNLLIPCYFQEGTVSFAAILQGVVKSEIVTKSKYQNIVFVVNEGNFDFEKLDKEALAKSGISKVVYFKKNTNTPKDCLISSEGQKCITVIEGAFLPDDTYIDLLDSAQIFLGCSGDKSLEAAIRRGLIPLYQAPFEKCFVLDNFICVLNYLAPGLDFSFLEALLGSNHKTENCNNTEIVSLAQNISRGLTVALRERWSQIAAELQKRFNFAKVLPYIITQTIYYGKIYENNNVVQTKQLQSLIQKQNQLLSTAVDELEPFIVGRQEVEFKAFLEYLDSQNCPESLKISQHFLSSRQWIELFKALSKNLRIKHLSIVKQISQLLEEKGEIWKALTKMLAENSSLESLDLSGSIIPATYLKMLVTAILRKGSTLRTLSLNGCRFSDAHSIPNLLSMLLLPPSNIHTLHLAGNSLTETGAQILVKAMASKTIKSQLKTLNLVGNPLGMACMLTFEEMRQEQSQSAEGVTGNSLVVVTDLDGMDKKTRFEAMLDQDELDSLSEENIEGLMTRWEGIQDQPETSSSWFLLEQEGKPSELRFTKAGASGTKSKALERTTNDATTASIAASAGSATSAASAANAASSATTTSSTTSPAKKSS